MSKRPRRTPATESTRLPLPAGVQEWHKSQRQFAPGRAGSKRGAPLSSKQLLTLVKRALDLWVGAAKRLELPDARESRRARRPEPVNLDDRELTFWADLESRLSTPAIREYVKLIRLATAAGGRFETFVADLDARLAKRRTLTDALAGRDRDDDYGPEEVLAALFELLTVFAPVVGSTRPTFSAGLDRVFTRSVTGTGVRHTQLQSERNTQAAETRKSDVRRALALQALKPAGGLSDAEAARLVAQERGLNPRSETGQSFSENLRRRIGDAKRSR